MDTEQTGHGVEALVERLRRQGIEAGRDEAARLLEQAQREISLQRQAMQAEATALMQQAREQSRIEREAARSALRLATRDALVQLKEAFLHQFSTRLARHVTHGLEDPALLRDVLLALLRGEPGLAGQPLEGPPDAPGEPMAQAMARLGDGLIAGMLRDGIELVAPAGQAGLLLRLVGEEIEVHATDEAIHALLLEHLLPGVRRRLEGETL